jgi:pimeloyl-ACP methyl ester carboxylesterase
VPGSRWRRCGICGRCPARATPRRRRGRLVDLGGYRVHLLAEGTTPAGRAPVVWFAGGHAGGFAIHHLHRAFRGETRSILIDRPGTGWSDAGPFPRSTAREADEMVLALERAGETGPFIWVGHSFGGLLAANIARRRPDLVHTVVLLDPTPLETIVFGPRLGALADMRRTAWRGGFAQLFGINLAQRAEARARQTPAYAKVIDATRAVLGPEVAAARPIEANAGAWFTQASIYGELSPEGAAAVAWDTVVYDRDLGDLPVWLVGPARRRQRRRHRHRQPARSAAWQRRRGSAHAALLRRDARALPRHVDPRAPRGGAERLGPQLRLRTARLDDRHAAPADLR